MSHQSFPGWAGPIVGPLAGLAVGYKVAQGTDASDPSVTHWIMIGSAVAGLIAGLLVWFLDHRKR